MATWNAFVYNNGAAPLKDIDSGSGSWYTGVSPSRNRPLFSSDKTVINGVYTRIAIDVAMTEFRHSRVDKFGRFKEVVESGLQNCFTLEANIDQAPLQFFIDAVLTMFDNGVSAIVPVDTDVNPATNAVFDIKTMRIGKIVAWYPKHVRVSLYNVRNGKREEVTVAKSFAAIVENPLFSVMNEPNSTLQRLLRKLALLDAVDEQSGSGKLDIIIQLPYAVKSEMQANRAEQRRASLEAQLKDSQYGVAYADATEKIVQLNRPAENNLMGQIEYLVSILYGQLGITPEVLNGTADEKTMLNYRNRTVKPIVEAIAQAMQRTFLGSQRFGDGERILYFNNPFELVPLADVAESADKLTRNEIITSNEVRGFIGMTPSSDPKADKLINSNMPQQPEQAAPETKDESPETVNTEA